jgi:hypothetical protein
MKEQNVGNPDLDASNQSTIIPTGNPLFRLTKMNGLLGDLCVRGLDKDGGNE